MKASNDRIVIFWWSVPKVKAILSSSVICLEMVSSFVSYAMEFRRFYLLLMFSGLVWWHGQLRGSRCRGVEASARDRCVLPSADSPQAQILISFSSLRTSMLCLSAWQATPRGWTQLLGVICNCDMSARTAFINSLQLKY